MAKKSMQLASPWRGFFALRLLPGHHVQSMRTVVVRDFMVS
jgi:hypothetical protein